MKIVRFGQHDHKNGVITIASKVMNNQVYLGVSFCSPKEKQYDKKFFNTLSQERLGDAIANNQGQPYYGNVSYGDVLMKTISMIERQWHPNWAKPLLREAFVKPYGLKKYSSKTRSPIYKINKIKVESKEAKEQLILAIQHIELSLTGQTGSSTQYAAIHALISVLDNTTVIKIKK